jgi:hypothetical protein
MSTDSTSPEPILDAEAIPAAEPIGTPEGAGTAAEGATPAPPAMPDVAQAEAIATGAAASPAEAAAAQLAAGGTVAAPAATAATSTPGAFRRALAHELRLLGRFGVSLALVALGVAIGWNAYLGSRPAPAIGGDPSVIGQPAPAVVQEFAQAISSGDSDAIRSALQQEMFARYTAEMQRFGIASIDAVETLGTFTDGPRTATALILHGVTMDRSPFSLNLVVVTQDGLIVRLR